MEQSDGLEILREPLTPEQKQLATEYQQQLIRANSSIAAILSATEEFKKKYNSQLTALPAHPYEKYKKLYIDPSQPVLTVDQLPYPKCYSPITLMSEITSISKFYNERLLSQMPYVSAGNKEAGATIFTVLCGDSFVIDKKRMGEHFAFIEMLRNIPITEIEEKPLEIAYKLVNEFIRVYKP